MCERFYWVRLATSNPWKMVFENDVIHIFNVYTRVCSCERIHVLEDNASNKRKNWFLPEHTYTILYSSSIFFFLSNPIASEKKRWAVICEFEFLFTSKFNSKDFRLSGVRGRKKNGNEKISNCFTYASLEGRTPQSSNINIEL